VAEEEGDVSLAKPVEVFACGREAGKEERVVGERGGDGERQGQEQMEEKETEKEKQTSLCLPCTSPSVWHE
jgi:hypothetical protein